jgi:hypothetical protein
MANVAPNPREDLDALLAEVDTLHRRVAHELAMLKWTVVEAQRHMRRKRPDSDTMAEFARVLRAEVDRLRIAAGA